MSDEKQQVTVGQVLAGRYEIVRQLARGGMGSVYLARQLGLNLSVAIKVLHPEDRGDSEVAHLFRREAIAIKHLSHPNTVRIYDFGETEGGMLFLVMEYLNGQGLDSVLQRQGTFPLDRVVRIGCQVLKSLIEAHARGIVHRDIKPSNLVLCDQIGEPDFLKVIDFGIALHELREAPKVPSRYGELVGTPRYMSPEQLFGRPVDARSDLYSLALTLAELATGTPVFAAETFQDVLDYRLVHPEPTLGGGLDKTELGSILRRALADDLGVRFSAAGDMLIGLEGCLELLDPAAARRHSGSFVRVTAADVPAVQSRDTLPYPKNGVPSQIRPLPPRSTATESGPKPFPSVFPTEFVVSAGAGEDRAPALSANDSQAEPRPLAPIVRLSLAKPAATARQFPADWDESEFKRLDPEWVEEISGLHWFEPLALSPAIRQRVAKRLQWRMIATAIVVLAILSLPLVLTWWQTSAQASPVTAELEAPETPLVRVGF